DRDSKSDRSGRGDYTRRACPYRISWSALARGVPRTRRRELDQTHDALVERGDARPVLCARDPRRRKRQIRTRRAPLLSDSIVPQRPPHRFLNRGRRGRLRYDCVRRPENHRPRRLRRTPLSLPAFRCERPRTPLRTVENSRLTRARRLPLILVRRNLDPRRYRWWGSRGRPLSGGRGLPGRVRVRARTPPIFRVPLRFRRFRGRPRDSFPVEKIPTG